MTKNIVILGATGSIGRQALEVIEKSEGLSVKALSAHKNAGLLMSQIEKFSPEAVCLTDLESFETVRAAWENKGVRVLFGNHGLVELASLEYELLFNSLVGNAGILPTLKAIENNRDVALANKETLVSAGELIMERLKESTSALLPVDSEHSAIFQCLQGNSHNKINKIYLTASGGPFRTTPKAELPFVTAKDALKHPNWAMGQKITIDSATLMNKALEVIEAKYLFGVDFDDIEVLIHPQSIIHSMVEFKDKSVMAQLGCPDMRLPIAYAINYPNRIDYGFEGLDFLKIGALNFEKPRYGDFEAFGLMIKAAKTGGTMPAMVNAANEAAVYAFISGKIRFTDIAGIIESAMSAYNVKYDYDVSDILMADSFGKSFVKEALN